MCRGDFQTPKVGYILGGKGEGGDWELAIEQMPKWFVLVLSGHRYGACKFAHHVMHRAPAN